MYYQEQTAESYAESILASLVDENGEVDTEDFIVELEE